MKIWLLELDVNKYNSFNGYKVEEKLNIRFFGSSLVNNWNTPTIEAYYNKRKIADVSDFSSGAPLFNEKAVNMLNEFMNEKIELLPAYFDNDKYYVVNIINVIDALDYGMSEFKRFETGEIFRCTKYNFKPEIIKGQHIFKIPLGNSIDIFVSDGFKNRVEESKLKGFIFVEVWNSEEEPAKEILNTKDEDIKAESTYLELNVDSYKEKENEVYPDISEEEAKTLQIKIIENLYHVVLQHAKEIGKNKGTLDSIGLEYFFDGQYTDIGVRINVLLNSKKEYEEEYEEEYFELLDHPSITFDFNSLFNHYVKGYMNEEETTVFFGIIQETVLKLNDKVQNTIWHSITKVTKDFCVEAPELYD